MEGATAGRYTLEPGWRWSETEKPLVGTETCQLRHVGVAMAGRLHVPHDDSSETEAGPGDAHVIQLEHDAWVVGDETFVGDEFEAKSAEEYAKPQVASEEERAADET